MRELTMSEIKFVAGAGDDCSGGSQGNDLGGITDPANLGQDLINIYEGLVAVTSHVIERVANAL
jgi:hypothetical protein